jgi:hypothetical protein
MFTGVVEEAACSKVRRDFYGWTHEPPRISIRKSSCMQYLRRIGTFIQTIQSSMIRATVCSTPTVLRTLDHCLWAQVPYVVQIEQESARAIDRGQNWSLCFSGRFDGKLADGSWRHRHSASKCLGAKEFQSCAPIATSRCGFRPRRQKRGDLDR